MMRHLMSLHQPFDLQQVHDSRDCNCQCVVSQQVSNYTTSTAGGAELKQSFLALFESSAQAKSCWTPSTAYCCPTVIAAVQ